MAKLREALLKKSANNDAIVGKVMAEMGQYISEERTVEWLVRMYTEQSKTRPYIEQKLRAKKFQKEIIETTIESYRESFTSWNNYENVVTRKIRELLQKNRSLRYIRGTLIQRFPNFKNEISSLIDTLCPDETEAIRTEFEKLAKKYDSTNLKEWQKIIGKLSLKGFSYDAIRKAMDDSSPSS